MRGLADDQVIQVYASATAETPNPTAAAVRQHREQQLPLEASRPRRRPLPEAFRSQLWKSMRATDSLIWVTQDDRWPRHLEELAETSLEDLKKMIAALQTIHDVLESGVPGPNMTVKLVVGNNTATAIATKFAGNAVRYALKKANTKWQTDRRTGHIAFPARHADRFVEMLEVTSGFRVARERAQ